MKIIIKGFRSFIFLLLLSHLFILLFFTACSRSNYVDALSTRNVNSFGYKTDYYSELIIDINSEIDGDTIRTIMPHGIGFPDTVTASYEIDGYAFYVDGHMQQSGISEQTYSNDGAGITYRLYSYDGMSTDYDVSLVESNAYFESYSFTSSHNNLNADVEAEIAGNGLWVNLSHNDDLTSLIPSFTLSKTSTGCTINGVTQASGSDTIDLSSPVIYTITSEDGYACSYQVSPYRINSLSFKGSDNSLVSDFTARITDHEIVASLPSGTDLAGLVPTFDYSGTGVLINGESAESGSSSHSFAEGSTLTVITNGSASRSYNLRISNTGLACSAGSDKNITSGSAYVLNGWAASAEGDGALSYSWTCSGPETASLTDSTALSPSFSTSGISMGSYTFKLTVTNSSGYSVSDSVVITVGNAASPVAAVLDCSAGVDQDLSINNTCTLHGSGSSTYGDDTLSYQWTGPITLSDSTTLTPAFTAGTAGTYTFTLTVTNSTGKTESDTVTVTVVDKPVITVTNLYTSMSNKISFDWNVVTSTLSSLAVEAVNTSNSSDTKTANATEPYLSSKSGSITLSGLTADATYTVTVTATDSVGGTSVVTFTATTGSATHLIYTAEDLANVGIASYGGASSDYTSWHQNDTYIVMKDIDLSSADWTPIGGDSGAFTGNFDGNGHTITGMNVTTTGGNQGLFNRIVGGSSDVTVKGITFVNATLSQNYSNSYRNGILAGSVAVTVAYGKKVTISDCHVTGTSSVNVKGDTSSSYAGGLIGIASGIGADISLLTITGCTLTGDLTITTTKFATGGLAGYALYCTIENCTVGESAKNVQLTYNYQNNGGLIGYMERDSNISGCKTYITITPEISRENCCGGLIGRINISDSGFKISSCSSSGSVKGIGYIGGLVGYCYFRDNSGYTSIANSFSSCSVNGTSDYLGGFIGYMETDTSNSDKLTIESCSASGSVTGSTANSEYCGGFIGELLHPKGKAKILHSYSTGDVSGKTSIGGFVGRVDSNNADYNLIQYCFASGNVSGTSDSTYAMGGFVGSIHYGNIKDSYCRGEVNSANNSAGFAGQTSGSGSNYVKFYRCYTASTFTGTGTYHTFFGKDVGDDSIYYENCFSPAIGYASGDSDINVVTLGAMKSLTTFTDEGWNATTTDWGQDASYNDGYVYLKGVCWP